MCALRGFNWRRHSWSMPDRFASLDEVIRQAEAAAAEKIDPLGHLALLLKLMIASDADPYLLIGELTEAIAAATSRRIPAEKRGEVGIAALRLLNDRFMDYGVF